jgi:hypothetical protein
LREGRRHKTLNVGLHDNGLRLCIATINYTELTCPASAAGGRIRRDASYKQYHASIRQRLPDVAIVVALVAIVGRNAISLAADFGYSSLCIVRRIEARLKDVLIFSLERRAWFGFDRQAVE